MTIRKRLSTAMTLAAGLGLVGITSIASGQQPAPAPSPLLDDEGAGPRFPRTAEDHLAVAEEYAAKAVERRKEVELHRRMLAAYERLATDIAGQPTPPPKRGKTLPSGRRARSKDLVAQYHTHCEGYIRGAEMMAGEAQSLADFHQARARELRDAQEP